VTASTRDKIIHAASGVFEEKGFDGARMQEIADHAGVNKAMLYYYFHSKEDLFTTIFREMFAELFTSIQNLIPMQPEDLTDFIKQFVSLHIDFLAQHPHLPRIITREIHSSNPVIKRVMKEIYKESYKTNISSFFQLAEWAKKSDRIRSVDSLQTLWNILALDLFYFMVKPMLQTFWADECQNEEKLLQKRKKAIVDLLLYGLLPRHS
jgi:TetR/AcrR family transcriptional regulator